MEEIYIKLYRRHLEQKRPWEEIIILALVEQFSTQNRPGFYAGFKAMADITGIPKAKCKLIAQKLQQENLIQIQTGKVDGFTKLILKSTTLPRAGVS